MLKMLQYNILQALSGFDLLGTTNKENKQLFDCFLPSKVDKNDSIFGSF